MKPKPQSGVTRARAHGKPERIRFDPASHPGIIRRMFAFGMGKPSIAAVLGITERTLTLWLHKYPELDKARAQVAMRGPDLLDAMTHAALGTYDPETGEYEGGDVRAAMWLLEHEYGMVRPTAKESQEEVPKRGEDALAQAAARLVDTVGGEDQLREMVNAIARGGRQTPALEAP